MTPQQKMQTALRRTGIPAKEIKVFGSQILITTWSLDAAHRFAAVLANFCKVRGPVESVDYNVENRNTVLRPSKHKVWRVGGTISA